MTDGKDAGETHTVDYEQEYKRACAERDSFKDALDKYLEENTKLKADLTVQQAINRKTIGASDVPPKQEEIVKPNIVDKFSEYRANYKPKE